VQLGSLLASQDNNDSLTRIDSFSREIDSKVMSHLNFVKNSLMKARGCARDGVARTDKLKKELENAKETTNRGVFQDDCFTSGLKSLEIMIQNATEGAKKRQRRDAGWAREKNKRSKVAFTHG